MVVGDIPGQDMIVITPDGKKLEVELKSPKAEAGLDEVSADPDTSVRRDDLMDELVKLPLEVLEEAAAVKREKQTGTRVPSREVAQGLRPKGYQDPF